MTSLEPPWAALQGSSEDDGVAEATTGVSGLLEPKMLVTRPAAVGLEELDHACESARQMARRRMTWATGGPGTITQVPKEWLPDPDETWTLIEDALAMGSTDMLMTPGAAPAELGQAQLPLRQFLFRGAVVTMPDPLTISSVLGEEDAGLSLRHAQSRSDRLAELSDHVARAFDAHVDVTIMVGAAGVGMLAPGHRERGLVVCLGGFVDVIDPASNDGGVDRLSVGAATSISPDAEIRTQGDGLAAVIALEVPTMTDLWRATIVKSGFWPRFRGGLPMNPDEPIEVFGSEDRVATREVLRSAMTEVFTSESADEALAGWRAGIVPAPRRPPARRWAGGSSAVSPGATVQGRLPGGVGFLTKDWAEGRFTACAGGWVFSVTEADLEVLPLLISSEPIDAVALGPAGIDLAERLLALGLARTT